MKGFCAHHPLKIRWMATDAVSLAEFFLRSRVLSSFLDEITSRSLTTRAEIFPMSKSWNLNLNLIFRERDK